MTVPGHESVTKHVRLDRAPDAPPTALDVTDHHASAPLPGLRHLATLTSPLADGGVLPEPRHLAVKGDNLDALDVVFHSQGPDGTVDCVYLDPPYNTGGENIGTYADDFPGQRGDVDDWVEFMRPRINAAHRLLGPLGVLIVAIGDDEHHHLRVLLDDVFGAENFIANIVWDGSTRGDSRWVSQGAEYMLVYARDGAVLKKSGIRWREPRDGVSDILSAAADAWRMADGDPDAATILLKQWQRVLPSTHLARSKGLADYNKVDEHGDVYRYGPLAKPVPGNYRYDVLHPVTGLAVPTPENGWRMPQDKMTAMVAAGDVVFGPDETTPLRAKLRLREQADQVPRNVFASPRSRGAAHLKTLLGEVRFPFPKDHEVLMRWLGMAAPVDGLIVDFFAGSGSTAEAVLRLNAADGGTRRCVLVTNNEVAEETAVTLRAEGHVPGDAEWESHGVFQHVLVPRLTSLLTGIRPDGATHDHSIHGVVDIAEVAN